MIYKLFSKTYNFLLVIRWVWIISLNEFILHLKTTKVICCLIFHLVFKEFLVLHVYGKSDGWFPFAFFNTGVVMLVVLSCNIFWINHRQLYVFYRVLQELDPGTSFLILKVKYRQYWDVSYLRIFLEKHDQQDIFFFC